MFLSEYLMFLFKTFTIVLSIALVFFAYFYIKSRLKHSKEDGLLIIKDLSHHFQEVKLQMIKSVLHKNQIKSILKEFKKLLKEKRKKDDHANTYVLKFNGNIKILNAQSQSLLRITQFIRIRKLEKLKFIFTSWRSNFSIPKQ